MSKYTWKKGFKKLKPTKEDLLVALLLTLPYFLA
jgi:hypothetical protein